MSRRAAAERAETNGIGMLAKGSKVFVKNGESYVPVGINPRTKKPFGATKLYRMAFITETKDKARIYTVAYNKPTDNELPENANKVPSSSITSYEKFCKSLWNMNDDVRRANMIYMGVSIDDFPKPLTKAEAKKIEREERPNVLWAKILCRFARESASTHRSYRAVIISTFCVVRVDRLS